MNNAGIMTAIWSPAALLQVQLGVPDCSSRDTNQNCLTQQTNLTK